MDSEASSSSHPEVATRLRLAVTRLARRLRQEAASSGDAGELTPTAAAALASIERRGPMTPSELAEVEGVKRPTATLILGRLERDGLLERMPDPDDGRSSLVSATPAARQRLSLMRQRKSAYLARRIRDLPREDLEALARAASILEEMLDAEREEP